MVDHANNHFDKDDDGGAVVDTEKDEQFVRDLELAQQLSLAPPSSTPTALDNNTMVEKISCLIALQNRSSFYIPCQPPGGFISLLSNCFELRADANTTVLLSGCDDHFQSLRSEDVGWVVVGVTPKCLVPICFPIDKMPEKFCLVALFLSPKFPFS